MTEEALKPCPNEIEALSKMILLADLEAVERELDPGDEPWAEFIAEAVLTSQHIDQLRTTSGEANRLADELERLADTITDANIGHVASTMRRAAKALRAQPDRPADAVEAWRDYTSAPLSFDGGLISINRDGSGYFCVNESEADWETDDDGAATYIVAKFSAGEAHEIRNHLNKYFPPLSNPAASDLRAENARLREALKQMASRAHAALSQTDSAQESG